MWQSLEGGLSLGLGLVLLVAAVAKSLHPLSFELALVRLFPALLRPGRVTSRSARRLIVVGEGGLGSLLVYNVAHATVVVDAAAVVVFAVLLATVVSAWRRQLPCGCSGSSQRAASATDVMRGSILLGAAATGLVLDLSSSRAGVSSYASLLAAAGLILVAVLILPQALRRASAAGRAYVPTGRHDDASGGLGVSRRALIATGLAAAAALLVPWRSLSAPERADAKCCGVPGQQAALCAALAEICEACCEGKDQIIQIHGCVACCDQCFSQCLVSYPGCVMASCMGCYNNN